MLRHPRAGEGWRRPDFTGTRPIWRGAPSRSDSGIRIPAPGRRDGRHQKTTSNLLFFWRNLWV